MLLFFWHSSKSKYLKGRDKLLELGIPYAKEHVPLKKNQLLHDQQSSTANVRIVVTSTLLALPVSGVNGRVVQVLVQCTGIRPSGADGHVPGSWYRGRWRQLGGGGGDGHIPRHRALMQKGSPFLPTDLSPSNFSLSFVFLPYCSTSLYSFDAALWFFRPTSLSPSNFSLTFVLLSYCPTWDDQEQAEFTLTLLTRPSSPFIGSPKPQCNHCQKVSPLFWIASLMR